MILVSVCKKFEPSEDEIQRWQTLFEYSYLEAAEHIKNPKSDYARYRVSNVHWGLVRLEKEVEGYFRETYERWIKIGDQPASCHGKRKHNDTSLCQAESS